MTLAASDTLQEVAASANTLPDETPDSETVSATEEAQPQQSNDITDRPDWLPEKFWSSGNGPQFEELANSYSELEKWRMKSRDEALEHFKDEIVAESKDAIPEGVPESIDGYEFKFDETLLPANVKPEEFVAEDDDPMLAWWKSHCYDNRLPQDTFESGINAFLKADTENFPDHAGEMKKLGENGPERVAGVLRWLGANTSEKTAKTMGMVKMSADMVEALEEIQTSTGSRVPVSNTGASQAPSITSEDLRKMQQDPGYYNGTDTGLIKRVQEGYAQLSTQRATR